MRVCNAYVDVPVFKWLLTFSFFVHSKVQGSHVTVGLGLQLVSGRPGQDGEGPVFLVPLVLQQQEIVEAHGSTGRYKGIS